MLSGNILPQADSAYESRNYEDALHFYKQAENVNELFSDDQLYCYSKLLLEKGEAHGALSNAERISDTGRENFDFAVLLYHVNREAGAAGDKLISLLEEVCKYSYDDEMMFSLAELYAKNDSAHKSKRMCKRIINTFHSGIWVEKAQALLNAGGILPLDGSGEPISPRTRMNTMLVDMTESLEVPGETKPSPPNTVPVEMPEASEAPETDDVSLFLNEEFAGIVGMAAVKKELKDICNTIKVDQLKAKVLKLSAYESELACNFILCGNPGTGKTAVARIIGKVLHKIGIREKETFIEVDRSKLVAGVIGGTAIQTKDAIESARGGTLFIDEAYSLYKKGTNNDFGQEAIDTLLKDMEDNRMEYTVIMAGYKSQMTDMLNHSNPGFRSRFNYHIDIPDYSDDELIEIAHKMAEKHHNRIEPDGEKAIRKRIDRERIDETFGNARFIRELIEEAVKRRSTRIAKKEENTVTEEDIVLIRAEDIYRPDENAVSLKDLLEQLDNLTGLADAKKRIRELTDVISEQKEAEERGLSIGKADSTMHMTFKGNAGTGKTTVARLIGRIFGEMGILKRGNVFIECKREDLVGAYQGQTADKTKDVIRSAMGGVLFIDEAYALKNGDGDTFGQEAVNTLVAAMEDYRDSLVVILAGYTADIDKFLTANQGLRSRIANDLFFEDYTSDEMTDIFYDMARKDGLILSENLRDKVRTVLTEKSKKPDFGNARGVRNVFGDVKKIKARRPKNKDEDYKSIYAEDFEGV